MRPARSVTLQDLLSGVPWELNYNSPQAAGLVFAMPMLGDAGASRVRDLARGNIGTFAAGMAWTVNPVLGPVPLFSGSGAGAGDDYITLSKAMALGATHSIAYWLISNTVSAPYTGIVLGGTTGNYVGYMDATKIWYGASAADLGVAISYTRGTLAHFAFVRAGTTVRFYLNGLQIGSPQTINILSTLTVNIVGGYGNFTYCINGQLQGLVMSSLALPPSVIWQMAQSETMWELYMPLRRWWALKAPAGGWVGVYGARPELALPGGVRIEAVM